MTTHEGAAELWDDVGNPRNIRALVRGAKVYDPRLEVDAGGTAGASPTNASYVVYDDNSLGVGNAVNQYARDKQGQNPALIIADLLMNDDFGLGIPASKIDWPSVITAADNCDQLVVIPTSSVQKRFFASGVIFGSDSHRRSIEKILMAMDGDLLYSQGKYYIKAGVYEQPTETFTESDVVSAVQVKTATPRQDRYNQISGLFIDPSENYKLMEFGPITVDGAYARDNSEVLPEEIKLPFTSNRYAAQRIAWKKVNQSFAQTMIQVTVNLKGMRVRVGDRINLTLTDFESIDSGNWSPKIFKVISWGFAEDGSGVDLTLIEDASSFYDDPDEDDYSTIDAQGTITTALPDVPSPSSFTATSQINSIRLDWDIPPNNASWEQIWVFRNTTGTTPTDSDTPITRLRTTNFTDQRDADGTEYYYWIQAVKYPRGTTPASGNANKQKSPMIALSTPASGKIAATKIGNAVMGEDSVDTLQIADQAIGSAQIDTSIQSDNWHETNQTGWKIQRNGNAYFNSGAFRGTVTVGSTDLTEANTLNINASASDVGLNVAAALEHITNGAVANITFTPDFINSNANIGEVTISAGVMKAGSTTRTTAQQVIVTPYEGSVKPPYSGNHFFIVWGASQAWASDSSARFQTSDSTTTSYGGTSPIFVAIYDEANDQWKAVDNANNTINFTPLASDYAIAVGTKTSSTGGIDALDSLVVFAADPEADQTVNALETGTTITSGGITLSSGGSIKGGQTEYNDADASGFFLGYDSNAYKFSIGNNDNSQRLTFDGSNLSVKGTITVGSTNLTEANTLNSNTNATDVAGLPQATFTSIGSSNYSPAVNGSRVTWTETNTATDWATKLVSDQSFSGGAFVTFVVNKDNATDSRYMIGLANVATGNSYTVIDHAIFIRGTANDIRAYESGSNAAQLKSTLTAGDVCTVFYDGNKVQYIINGTVAREVNLTAPLTGQIYAHIAIDDDSTHGVEHRIDGLQFGPVTSVVENLVDGVQITGGGITMSEGGAIKTVNKDSETDTTDGFFMGYNGSAYTFAIGNGTKSMTWDGTDLTVKGGIIGTTVTVASGTTITDEARIIENDLIDTDFPTGVTYYWPCNSIADVDGDGDEEIQEVIAGKTGIHSGSRAPTISTDSPSGRSIVNGTNNSGWTLLSDTDADALETANGFAWSLWFKSDTTSGDTQARIIGRDASDGWAVLINQSTTGNQAVTLYGEPSTEAMGSLAQGEWHHFCLSEDGNGTISGYVNGELVSTESYTPLSSSRPVVIACNTESAINTASNVFEGKLTEIRAYNRALTAKEVRSLYKNPTAGSPARIDGDLIVSNSITTSQIAADAITTTEISVTDLSGISNNVGTITDGSVGGINIDATKIYAGSNGNYQNSDTGFYLDNTGKFSLKDKLFFDPSNNTLTVDGNITADVITAKQNLVVLGDLEASSVAIGSITREMLSQDALDEIFGSLAASVGGSNGDFKEGTGTFTTSGGSITLGTSSDKFDHGAGSVDVEFNINQYFYSTTNYTDTQAQATLTFEATADGTFNDLNSADKTHTLQFLEYDLSGFYGYTYLVYYLNTAITKTFTSGTGNDLADNTDVQFRVAVSGVGSAFTNQTLEFSASANEGVTGVTSTGGNADTLDNLDSTKFLRSDVDSTIDANLTVTGSLSLTGDLNITGDLNSYNVTDLDVTDRTITLNAGGTTSTADGGGIVLEKAVDASTNASILWDGTNDEWDFSHNLSTAGQYLDFTGGGAYIGTTTAHALRLQTNDTEALRLTSGQNAVFAGDVSINAAKRLYLDNGTHTYIEEVSSDVLRIVVGGDEFMRFAEGTSNLITMGDPVLIDSDNNVQNVFKVRADNTISNENFYATTFDFNFSGTQTHTTDNYKYGLYIDFDSSDSGGDASNETRLFPLYIDARNNAGGTADRLDAAYIYARNDGSSNMANLRGTFSYAFANNSAGTTTNVYGIQSYGYDDTSGSGSVSTVIGTYSLGYASGTGTGTLTSVFGAWNMAVSDSTNTKNITNMYGARNEVQLDSTSNAHTITNVYATFADIDENDPEDQHTVTNGYLYYGQMSGTLPTNAYGVYIATAVENYFAGDITSNGDIQSSKFKISSDTEHSLSYLTTSAISGANVHVSELRGRQIDLYAYDDILLRAGSADDIKFYSGAALALTLDSNQQATFTNNITTASHTITGYKLRATSSADASLSSTDHAFQTGSSAGGNIIIDTNEIMARNNGAASDLHLQADGGQITIGNNLDGRIFLSPTNDNTTLTIRGGANDDAILKLLESGTGDVGAIIEYHGGDNVLRFKVGNNPPNTALEIDRDTGAATFEDKVTAKDQIRAEVVSYANNQNAPYMIAGTGGWTGATTNWNTYGIQHRIKTSSGGVPRVTIDTAVGEMFSVDNNGNATIAGKLEFTANPFYIRNNQDNSGQLLIQNKNSSGTLRGVRWDAANASGGAWRPDATDTSNLGLTNRIWNTLYVNNIRMGTGNTLFVNANREINASSLTLETGTVGTSPNIFKITTSTEANTAQGAVYAGLEFAVTGAETGGGNISGGVVSAIKAIDYRANTTSYEDAGIGFYTLDSDESAVTFRGGFSNQGGFFVSVDGNVDRNTGEGDIYADSNIEAGNNLTFNNSLKFGSTVIINNSGELKNINTISIPDGDFALVDGQNTGETNIIWRDHSADRLYLGTTTDVVEFRGNVNFQSGHTLSHDDNVILDSSRNLTNIANITMTGTEFRFVSSVDSNLGMLLRDETYVSDEMDITATRLGSGNTPTLGIAGQSGINFYVSGSNVGSFDGTYFKTTSVIQAEPLGTATSSSNQFNSADIRLYASGWDTNNAVARTVGWKIRNIPTASVYPDHDLHFIEDDQGSQYTKFTLHGRGSTNHTDPRAGTFFGNLHVEAGSGTNAGVGTATIASDTTVSNGKLRMVRTGDNFPTFEIARTGGSSKTNQQWDFTIGSTGHLNIRSGTGSTYYPIILTNAGDISLGSDTAGANPSVSIDQSNKKTTFNGLAQFTNTDSTGRGIYRNNTGYDLRLGGGTSSSNGAYISLSGETRGGSGSGYNGRLEYYTGGSGFANQAAVLGDHKWYAAYSGGAANLMSLDSVTGDLTIHQGDIRIPVARNIYFGNGDHTYIGEDTDDRLRFFTGGAEFMRFTESTNDTISFYQRVEHSVTNPTNAYKLTVTDSDPTTSQNGLLVDYNASGNTALTADFTHVGIKVDFDVTSTGGNTTDEYRAYGIYSDLRGVGDTDLRYAIYGYSETEHSSGQVSDNVGVYGYAVADDTGTGHTSNNTGGKFLAYAYNTGTGGTTNHYGVYSKVLLTSAADKNTSSATGVYGEVEVDTSGTTTTLTTAYVFRAEFDQDATDTTVTNGYLFYGNYAGTQPNNAYGVYITDAVRNYFGGYITTGDGSVSSPSYSFNGDANTGMYSPANHQLGFCVNGSRKFYMTETKAYFQNLTSGITVGTETGDAFNSGSLLRLQQNANTYVQIKTGTSQQCGLLLGDTSDDFVGGLIYRNSDNHLDFYANNVQGARLKSDKSFKVYGTTLEVGDSGTNGVIDVKATANAYYKVNGTTRFTLTSGGNATFTGNVTAFSDARLKSDIKTLDGSKVYAMRGVSYTTNGEAGSGVVAQELEQVASELVIDNDDGYKSVAYGNLVGYLIEAVKDQKAIIDDLTKRIEELENGDN